MKETAQRQSPHKSSLKGRVEAKRRSQLKPVVRSSRNRSKVEGEKDALDIINEQKDHERSKSREDRAGEQDEVVNSL